MKVNKQTNKQTIKQPTIGDMHNILNSISLKLFQPLGRCRLFQVFMRKNKNLKRTSVMIKNLPQSCTIEAWRSDSWRSMFQRKRMLCPGKPPETSGWRRLSWILWLPLPTHEVYQQVAFRLRLRELGEPRCDSRLGVELKLSQYNSSVGKKERKSGLTIPHHSLKILLQ